MSNQRIALVGVLLVVVLVVILLLLRSTSGSAATAPRLIAAAGITALAAMWMLVNGDLDDPVLFSAGPQQGLTVADLPSGILLVVAAAMAIPRRRERR